MEAGLPNITGSFARRDDAGVFGGLVNLTGAFYGTSTKSWRTRCTTGSYGNVYLNFDASRSNSIYGASSTVQPPALTVRFLIRAKS